MGLHLKDKVFKDATKVKMSQRVGCVSRFWLGYTCKRKCGYRHTQRKVSVAEHSAWCWAGLHKWWGGLWGRKSRIRLADLAAATTKPLIRGILLRQSWCLQSVTHVYRIKCELCEKQSGDVPRALQRRHLTNTDWHLLPIYPVKTLIVTKLKVCSYS